VNHQLSTQEFSSAQGVKHMHCFSFLLTFASALWYVLSSCALFLGSGKSSLLSALLGEMRRVQGSVSLAGRVAFCPQQPCIMNATVMDNVLFGLPYDEAKYAQALKFAALMPDLDLLPARDKTEIGERGITLSGGQKARVSMARALFASADVLLLDDPLRSARQITERATTGESNSAGGRRLRALMNRVLMLSSCLCYCVLVSARSMRTWATSSSTPASARLWRTARVCS
jgi:ABC-type transport system involved in cytochrome c biogenesis ATPase subunit